MDFESSIKKLETITEALESPKTTLDKSLALYKEGIALAKSCGDVLKNYETEVQLLQKDSDGIFSTVRFGDDYD